MTVHTRAALQALFVTLLWSTSWVLIKIGLDDIPALTFAGLRYVLAFLCLLPFAWQSGQLAALRRLPRADGRRLAVLGLLYYTVTQGAQFLGLERLPAATTSLLFSFTTGVVALLGIPMLSERPTRGQWGGIAVYLLGALVYFYPVTLPREQVVGLLIMLGGVLSNALSAVLGRDVNRTATLPALAVTVASMGVGSVVLLGAGIVTQGLPALSASGWLIIAWLALVNTAFAFTLWNHTQRTLPAVETSIINNTMLIQIAVLAWVFLGEALNAREIGGLALAAAGTLLVQLNRRQGGLVESQRRRKRRES
ncbi:MAG: EamA family transporter [Anaerolineae bacterium]|nr:EamA family transporter [Anaerolineae bacterium]